MRSGPFYEHQMPRPWDPDGEERLLSDLPAGKPLFADRLDISGDLTAATRLMGTLGAAEDLY